jgi:hypothetical protein
MKRISLYLDTSSLFNGGVTGLEIQIQSLIKLLRDNKNIELLTNDILSAEIRQNIKGIDFPERKLRICLGDKVTENAKKIFDSNKKKYLNLIDDLFNVSKKIDVDIVNKDIVDGVDRQYNRKFPWKDGKPNEWKDFFVQCALLHYSESKRCKMIICSQDEDFDEMKRNKVDVQKLPLKDFLSYVDLYLNNDRDKFKAYLLSKIYSDLEYDIMDKILEMADLDEVFVGIESDDEPEITIEDIQILDIRDKKLIPILVKANIYGFVGNYYADDDRGEIYGVKSDKIVEYKMFFSFEGNFDRHEFQRDLMDGARVDNNIVKIVTEDVYDK